MLTDRDLSRLLALQYVHGGKLESIPHGVVSSFDALKRNGLVTIDVDEDGSLIALTETTITDKGKLVAESGMRAMREAL